MENAMDPGYYPGGNASPAIQNQRRLAKKRASRAKRHVAWENAVERSQGRYEASMREIARRYPQLTPMELRVATLVRAMLLSWQIAELLGIAEVTVERIRCRIRRKIGLDKQNLQTHLMAI